MKHYDLIDQRKFTEQARACSVNLARRPYSIHPALTEVVQNALLDVMDAA